MADMPVVTDAEVVPGLGAYGQALTSAALRYGESTVDGQRNSLMLVLCPYWSEHLIITANMFT